MKPVNKNKNYTFFNILLTASLVLPDTAINRGTLFTIGVVLGLGLDFNKT